MKSCLAASLEDKSSPKGNCMVMEVFSPPRLAPQVQHLGLEAKSYDLKTGYDLSTKHIEDKSKKTWSASSLNSWFCALLARMKAVGFIWIVPNGIEGSTWFELHGVGVSFVGVANCRMQVSQGGRALFEHPTGSKIWSYSEVQALCRKCAGLDWDIRRVSVWLGKAPDS